MGRRWLGIKVLIINSYFFFFFVRGSFLGKFCGIFMVLRSYMMEIFKKKFRISII